jgi:hypothetical protein
VLGGLNPRVASPVVFTHPMSNLVPFEVDNFRVVSHCPQLSSKTGLEAVKKSTKRCVPLGGLAVLFVMFPVCTLNDTLLQKINPPRVSP